MNNIMFDLETWGTRPGCAIRSAGAVVFDFNGIIGEQFYRNVSDASCAGIGLFWEPQTVEWWQRQSLEATSHLYEGPRPIAEVMDQFHDFFRANNAGYLWCQGANFDEPIWQAAAYRLRRGVPWKYSNVRCTRTAYDLHGLDPRSVPREGTQHNALDDAIHQARCVQAAVRMRVAA